MFSFEELDNLLRLLCTMQCFMLYVVSVTARLTVRAMRLLLSHDYVSTTKKTYGTRPGAHVLHLCY